MSDPIPFPKPFLHRVSRAASGQQSSFVAQLMAVFGKSKEEAERMFLNRQDQVLIKIAAETIEACGAEAWYALLTSHLAEAEREVEMAAAPKGPDK